MNAIKGGVIPGGFIPAVEKGIVEAMAGGVLAGYPMKDVKVRLYDGQHHTVDSSEMAFKIAGSMAFKQAVAEADAYLLEPIMQMTISVPEDAVGDVIGDLNSRRGHPLGMEPKGTATEIKAEVPMAEVLDYAPDLRAITGGRGDYTMEFLRYEEVPGHIAQKVIAEAEADEQDSGVAASNSERVVVNVDGGARGNPGPAAIAAVVATPDGEVVDRAAEAIGRATNNVAEYRALLLGIERAAAAGASDGRARRRLGADRQAGARRVPRQGRGPAPASHRGPRGARRIRALVDPPRAPRAQRRGRRARQRALDEAG